MRRRGEPGQLGQIGDLDPGRRRGAAGVRLGLGGGEGLAEALHVRARIARHDPECLLHPLLRALVVGEAEARDVGAQQGAVALRLRRDAGAGLRVEHLEHGGPVAVAADETAHLAVGERRSRSEGPGLLGDGARSRLLSAHRVEFGDHEEAAGAGSRVFLCVGLGAQPLGAGDPRVALLLAEQERARVLLALEGDGRRPPRGEQPDGGGDGGAPLVDLGRLRDRDGRRLLDLERGGVDVEGLLIGLRDLAAGAGPRGRPASSSSPVEVSKRP